MVEARAPKEPSGRWSERILLVVLRSARRTAAEFSSSHQRRAWSATGVVEVANGA